MSDSKGASQEVGTKPRPRARIESLSDMIFGLALSIGAISLVGSIGNITTTYILLRDITTFGYSFLILIMVWMRYTRIMSVLPFERRWTVSLNIALLFAVSIEPFLFNVLQMGIATIKDNASQIYAADLGAMMAILALFTFVLADEDRNLVPKDQLREFKAEAVTLSTAGAVFFFSTLEIFWQSLAPDGTPWRLYIWIIPFVLSAARRRGQSIIHRIKKLRRQK